MPNEVKTNEDGTVEFRLETGEVYKGEPIEVLNAMGKSYVSEKRWTQNIKAENETLKAQRLNPPEPTPAPPPPQNADEAALDGYLLERHAKALGFNSASEYKRKLDFIDSTTREMKEQRDTEDIAMKFQGAYQNFPNTEEANAAIVEILTQSVGPNEPVRYNDVVAAHSEAIRRGMYKPLNSDEINMAANQQAIQQQARPVPPQPPGGNNPDGSQNNVNPWQQTTDELRKQLLAGGGLGKALLDLKPGETFGG